MRKSILLLTVVLITFSCSTDNKSEKVKAEFDKVFQQVRQEFAPDKRDKTFEATLDIEESGSYVLRGSASENEAKEALVIALKDLGVEILDSMAVLPHPNLGEKTFGLTAQSVINFRTAPGYASESATQTVMGTPLRLLEKRRGWTRAITPEGYISWVSSGSIHEMTEGEYNNWLSASKLIVINHYTLFKESASHNSAVVSDGVWGSIVTNQGRVGSFYKVGLPGNRTAYVPASDVLEFERWLNSRNPTPDNVIAVASQFLGFPYMWGGTSIKAMDCSGFTKTTFYLNGVIIRRDASQQARTGTDVDISEGIDNLQKGDLLFFGSKATEERPERITHVGFYIANGEFIHSATTVKINSLIPDTHNYYSGSNRLVRANRFVTDIDVDANIISIKNHPWYFSN